MPNEERRGWRWWHGWWWRRGWPWLRGPAVALVVYVALMACILTLGPRAGHAGGPPCLFRLLTGVPCPTCGTTRMVVAAWHGDWGEALRLNPAMFVLMITGPIALGWHLLRARRRGAAAKSWRGRVLMGAVVVGLVVNWVYVLRAA